MIGPFLQVVYKVILNDFDLLTLFDVGIKNYVENYKL